MDTTIYPSIHLHNPINMKLARTLLILVYSLTSACSTLGYYAQSVGGHLQVMQRQVSIDEIIADQGSDPRLKQQLTDTMGILEYARAELDLPDNGSYRKYADIQREYIVWNIFAAPEFSLQPKMWCYLVIGCTSYRGYFNKAQALTEARQLAAAGWDVSVNGVIAYSTLGWFRDPVLNTMLLRGNWETARLLFHELAHQRFYFRDDTDFNEAFADAVAHIGLQGWLQRQSSETRLSALTLIERENRFYDLVLAARDKFAELYQSGLSDQDMRAEKSSLISQLQADYPGLKSGWDGDTRYDDWIATNINNASLSALATYRSLISDFLAAYEFHGYDLPRFYQWIEQLSDCAKPERLLLLRHPAQMPYCAD